MTTPAKKFRSKWVRIFCEGATTDGRTIERAGSSRWQPATTRTPTAPA